MEFSSPVILEDKSRLTDIYNLRITAYEHSYKSIYVNKEVFPEGWKDDLDERAIHWVVEYDNNIIASARLAVLNDLSETGEDIYDFHLPEGRPFAYYSRLVVHPNFQGYGLSKILDAVRVKYIEDEPIAFGLAFSFDDRSKSLLKLGFKELGIVNYKWCGLPLPQTVQRFFIFEK